MKSLLSPTLRATFLTWGLPLLVGLGIWGLFGVYWGWSDDVLMENLLRGRFSGEPLSDFILHHRGTGWVLMGLYKLIPGLSWYGLAMHLFLYLALVLFHRILGQIFRERKWGMSSLLAVLLFLDLGLCAEHILLLTFTKTAILLSGGAIFSVFLELRKDNPSPLKLMGFWLLFLIGLLTRYQIGWLVSFLLVLPLCIVWLHTQLQWKRGLLFIIIIGGTIAGHALTESVVESSRRTEHLERWDHLFNVLDGFNGSDFHSFASQEDSIRAVSVGLWYFQDRNQINDAFLQRMDTQGQFSPEILKNWRANLLAEYHKAASWYPEEYCPELNWSWKIWFFLLSGLLLVIRGFSAPLRENAPKWAHWLPLAFWLFYWGFILCLTIFIKMEDRVFSTLSILYLFNLLILHLQFHATNWESTLRNPLIRTTLLLAVIGFISWRMTAIAAISTDKAKELNQKEAFIRELPELEAEIVLFDYWSMALMHQGMLETTPLIDQPITTVKGEFFLDEFGFHRKYLADLCETDELSGFYDCLFSRRDEVLFAFSRVRADMLNEYLHILYHKNYKLEEVRPESELSKIRFSFLWTPLDFGYYRLVPDSIQADSLPRSAPE